MATRMALELPSAQNRFLLTGSPLVYLDTATMRLDGALQVQRRWVTQDGLRVLASVDDADPHGELLHVSCSRADRLPSWDEVHAVRDALFPADADVMLVLPRREDYVNLHQFTLHLWQTPRAWGIR